MKKETITQVILTAEDGMYLTDGEVYGKTAVLPAGADPEVWREVPEEAYLAHLEAQAAAL
jgi:hypothetical protein